MSIYDKASLVLIPSGTKTSKVYSQKPTNGDGDFTFSRSTAATRVNASGNIEKETGNLLLQSNTFDSGLWQSLNTTETGGQAGYDGTNNAWLLSKSAAAARVYQTISISGVQTYSVYAKAGTLNWVAISNNLVYTYFDLANGVIGTDVNTIDSNIESVGGGWYRCSITYTGTATDARVYPSQGDNNSSGTSGNIYIQDAQLEQGLVARDYIETTTTAIYGGITDNVPRLDYTDSSCPALLLEPQRTNLIQSTEYIAHGVYGYTLPLTPTLTSGIISPSNEANAYNVTDFVAANTRLDCSTAVSAASAGTHTYSAYYKGSGSINIALNTTIGGGSGGNEKTITLTNEWVRHEITHTYDATDGGNIRVHIAISRTANNTASVDVAFPQIEAGSYATSYIPTYGSSVTRNGELATQSSSAIGNPTSWSLFFECARTELESTQDAITLEDSTGSIEQIRLHFDSPASSVRFRDARNSYQNIGSSLSVTKDTFFKGCITSDGTTLKAYWNGALSGSRAVANQHDVDRVFMFSKGFKTKQLLVFPTALTDQEAIDLTTI